jgi:hypothetical protein
MFIEACSYLIYACAIAGLAFPVVCGCLARQR